MYNSDGTYETDSPLMGGGSYQEYDDLVEEKQYGSNSNLIFESDLSSPPSERERIDFSRVQGGCEFSNRIPPPEELENTSRRETVAFTSSSIPPPRELEETPSPRRELEEVGDDSIFEEMLNAVSEQWDNPSFQQFSGISDESWEIDLHQGYQGEQAVGNVRDDFVDIPAADYLSFSDFEVQGQGNVLDGDNQWGPMKPSSDFEDWNQNASIKPWGQSNNNNNNNNKPSQVYSDMASRDAIVMTMAKSRGRKMRKKIIKYRITEFKRECCQRGVKYGGSVLETVYKTVDPNAGILYVSSMRRNSHVRYAISKKNKLHSFLYWNLRWKKERSEKKTLIWFPRSLFSDADITRLLALSGSYEKFTCNSVSLKQCNNSPTHQKTIDLKESCWNTTKNVTVTKDWVKIVAECDLLKKKEEMERIKEGGVSTYYLVFKMSLELVDKYVDFKMRMKTNVQRKEREVPYDLYNFRKIPFNYSIVKK